ncbi:glycine betaine transporter [Geomicrobium sediminis]|uniref:Glycine betaine transporter n=1 Tax=Geomicrobium sediminis TaxID=1347788 RepID=A0ABS2PI81_9BACL|nr:glycine betaine transporter [Geomicrobium sediminis]GAK08778.1 glycine betaine transporter OpuD [Geomicrobium sp. JCM 19038]
MNRLKRIDSVFIISGIIILVLVLIGSIIPDQLEEWTATAQDFISNTFGWYYLILVTMFLIVTLYLMFGPMGKMKLGKPDEKPEFSRLSWLSMLFSAGMGVGLVFFGAAEPLSHYAIQAPVSAEGTGTDQAVNNAIMFTVFHWGLHGWAVYCILALSLAYFNFRHDRPGLISSTLHPIFGDKINGPIGKATDIIAVLATVTGVATTIGLGATQVNGGLAYAFDWDMSFWLQVGIVAIVTVLFLMSAWNGLDKGIKVLSNLNMSVIAVIFLLLLATGPTMYVLNLFTNTIGSYIQNLPELSFRIAPHNEEDRQWINDWTLFYWAWWIAWAPFVGIFIARVSRGRTIREFVTAVLLVPTVIVFIWFSVFGGAAIALEHNGTAMISDYITEQMLFATFDQYGFGTLMSILTIFALFVFLVTSADSATFVLGMLTTNGSNNPPNRLKIIWGVLLSATALVLLYSGGLQALQNTLIVAALPFSVIMLLMMIGLVMVMTKEAKNLRKTKS